MKFFEIPETIAAQNIQTDRVNHYLLKRPLLLFFCLLALMFGAFEWQDHRQHAHIVKNLAMESAAKFETTLFKSARFDSVRKTSGAVSSSKETGSDTPAFLSDEDIRQLNKSLVQDGGGIQARVYRRALKPRTSSKDYNQTFIHEARKSLKQNPGQPYYRFDSTGGQTVFKLARISPPFNSVDGKNSGLILEVLVPMGSAVEFNLHNKFSSTTFLAICAILMFSFFAFVLRNLKLEKSRAETLLEKAQQADMLKTEFLSTTSHELRTPLTAISGSLSIVLSNALGEVPDKPKTLLKMAHDNCSRLMVLVNDILDVNKMIAGEMSFNFEAHGLSGLIDSAIDGNRGYAETYNTKFNWEPLEEEVFVNVDSNRFQQVMSNLMSNAAKFSPVGENVQISVISNAEYHRISVSDKGPGIPDNFKDRVFDRFSQADSSDTKNTGGTGLGLRITKMIVEEFGGKIGFDSEEGCGTTFYFDLEVCHPETFEDDAPQIEAIAS